MFGLFCEIKDHAQNKKTKKMINYLVNKTKSPKKAAREAIARVNKGLPPKKIKGIKIKIPGRKKLTKKQIKKMKPQARKKLAKRAAKAAKQAAKAEKIVIPGLGKNDEPGSISTYAMTVMKTKKLKNYDRCIDNRIYCIYCCTVAVWPVDGRAAQKRLYFASSSFFTI